MDLKHNLQKILQLFKSTGFQIGVILIAMGIIFTFLNTLYLSFRYDSLPFLPDAILDHLPIINMTVLSDLFLAFAVLGFLIYAYLKDFKNLPIFFILFGIFEVLRGILIGATPYRVPNDLGISNWNIFKIGAFPSGHTGASFLAFLLAKGKFKFIFLAISIITIVLLLLSKSHYTIDIVAAIIFSYAICQFGNMYLKKYRLKKENV